MVRVLRGQVRGRSALALSCLSGGIIMQQASDTSQTAVLAAEALTLHFFTELLLILVVSRLVAWLAVRYLGQTRSIGEVFAGIILGPSVFGLLLPDTFAAFFSTEVSTAFAVLAQFGLLLMMFHMGLEFDISTQFRQRSRTVISISVLGIVLPFVLGVGTAGWFWQRIEGARPDLTSFALFMGVAMSITAIPVLGRIFMELGLGRSRIAGITMGAATVDDLAGWVLLGIVSALATSRLDLETFAVKLALLVLFVWMLVRVIGPRLARRIDRYLDMRKTLDLPLLTALLVVLLLASMASSRLGVFAIAGGLIAGIALQHSIHLRQAWEERASPLVYAVFLPVFFTYTGLRTDIGSLQTLQDVWAGVLLCVIAFSGKFVGGYAAARLNGESRRDAAVIGVCMNTRGLMELIVINVAYDLGVLPRQMFTMLVFMALISTFMAAPLIRHLLLGRRSPADAPVAG